MAQGERRRRLELIGPGLLVAATGVGAGDLATAGFAGSALGTAVLWAVVVGAFVKFVLNEGLARWQLATGETLLEGALTRLGRPAVVLFALYLLPWSFFVGAALISACGVTSVALIEGGSKFWLGVLHSGVGVVLAWAGGFRVVERVMAACIGVMFFSVVLTAVLLRPDPAALVRGLLWPTIPQIHDGGLTWTIALLGGVGGTLTVLCYGYWIRESGRRGPEALKTCRIDLAVAYAATALFGIAMIVIAAGTRSAIDGRGVGLILSLAAQLESTIGPPGRLVFLVGAWAAVFSSLLGVWQAVPYVFADFWRLRAGRPRKAELSARSKAYRGYLLALATIPLLQVSHPFREVQRYYAVIGAAFIPLLALTLLLLNGRRRWVGDLSNRPATVVVLGLALLISLVAGLLEVRARWM